MHMRTPQAVTNFLLLQNVPSTLTASVSVVIDPVLLVSLDDILGGDVSTGLVAVYLKRNTLKSLILLTT